jgi:hypothetical protein
MVFIDPHPVFLCAAGLRALTRASGQAGLARSSSSKKVF